MRRMFGYCIRGSHPLMKFQLKGYDVFSVRISHVACFINNSDLRIEDNLHLKLEKFF